MSSQTVLSLREFRSRWFNIINEYVTRVHDWPVTSNTDLYNWCIELTSHFEGLRRDLDALSLYHCYGYRYGDEYYFVTDSGYEARRYCQVQQRYRCYRTGRPLEFTRTRD